MTMVAFDTLVAAGGAVIASGDIRVVRAPIANSRYTDGELKKGGMSESFSLEKVEGDTGLLVYRPVVHGAQRSLKLRFANPVLCVTLTSDSHDIESAE